jgi:hypothetical protein
LGSIDRGSPCLRNTTQLFGDGIIPCLQMVRAQLGAIDKALQNNTKFLKRNYLSSGGTYSVGLNRQR